MSRRTVTSISFMMLFGMLLAACGGGAAPAADTSALDAQIADLQAQLEEAKAMTADAEAAAAAAAAAGGETMTETMTETVEVAVTFAGGGDTLAAVQDRGILNCGVSGTLLAFAFVEADGSVVGFDVDYCRAVAAATLGDSEALEIRTSNASERFPHPAKWRDRCPHPQHNLDLQPRHLSWLQLRTGHLL